MERTDTRAMARLGCSPAPSVAAQITDHRCFLPLLTADPTASLISGQIKSLTRECLRLYESLAPVFIPDVNFYCASRLHWRFLEDSRRTVVKLNITLMLVHDCSALGHCSVVFCCRIHTPPLTMVLANHQT